MPLKDNIFLFVPNLIGYGRVVFGVASLFYMHDSPYTAMTLYWLSAFLDAFDGMAARALDQTTIFGAVLDMVSDRCTTLALMMTLGVFYPKYLVYFQLLAVLDISSHWMHMYSSLIKGNSSHKQIDLSANPLLRIYYKSRTVLFIMCAANELFFMALYFVHFTPGPLLPLFAKPLGLWELMGYVCFPLFALKHSISVIQMIAAARNIGFVDSAEVEKRRQLLKHN